MVFIEINSSFIYLEAMLKKCVKFYDKMIDFCQILLPRIKSLAFSPIIIVVALVFDPIKLGMVEESQIRIFSIPHTRN